MSTRKYVKTEDRKKFYKDMWEKYEGKCMICGNPERLVIDHDHRTGIMRGLLCYSHNSGLGMFQDDPLLLTRAIEYLQHNEQHQIVPPPISIKELRITEHQRIAQELFDSQEFVSDRDRARRLSILVGISYQAAQTRMSRLRQKQKDVDASV